MFAEQTMPPIDTMPGVFRIVSTSCVPAPNGRGVTYRVELYHDRAQLAVTFTRSQPDIRLRADLLVSVRWKLPVTTIKGAIQISRLVLLEHPIKGVNPFEMVPPRWVKDRNLVRQAKNLLDALPDNLRQLVCSILWNGVRFRLFCDRPASMRDHHANLNGNLRHTVEVAEMVRLLASKYPQANLGISLTAALLHDAGKAAEYGTWSNGDWCMTDRGKLIRISGSGVSVISRNTQGVKLIGMEEGEKVTGAARLAEKEDGEDGEEEVPETHGESHE